MWQGSHCGSRDFNLNTVQAMGSAIFQAVMRGPTESVSKWFPERQDNGVLEPGMVTSDEPGLYIEGSHGIRNGEPDPVRKGREE